MRLENLVNVIQSIMKYYYENLDHGRSLKLRRFHDTSQSVMKSMKFTRFLVRLNSRYP